MGDLEELKASVTKCLRAFPDFPKKGILFQDIMPLFKDMALVDRVCKTMAEQATLKASKARGFLFGPLVALHLKVPFVPIRKAGKLPGKLCTAEYTKEYGADVVEMQADAIPPGGQVLIVDDLLATGGTMAAAIALVESSGHSVALAYCLIELTGLPGRSALPTNVPVECLLEMAD